AATATTRMTPQNSDASEFPFSHNYVNHSTASQQSMIANTHYFHVQVNGSYAYYGQSYSAPAAQNVQPLASDLITLQDQAYVAAQAAVFAMNAASNGYIPYQFSSPSSGTNTSVEIQNSASYSAAQSSAHAFDSPSTWMRPNNLTEEGYPETRSINLPRPKE